VKFEIKTDFLVDNQPTKIISGAIHYFRLAPSQWEDSLYNLKALGANTVETYIPWNIHEPQEGQFDFQGSKDVVQFIKLAEKMGLMVILRPSAYICAEWEFGGLPAWLLNIPGIRVRSTDEKYLEKVTQYFHKLLPILTPLQVTEGGPVIMMQIENEYGSYGMDKQYLQATKALMEKNGVSVPMFTSDGAWEEALDAGSLIDDNILVTGNFGSQSQKNAKVLAKFMEKHGKKWPIMCMEFWDGWFNRWGEPIVKRETAELAKAVKEMLQIGSINLYMFHGGTNFGFYNGCSARGAIDLPQVSSYDYGALLDEAGEPTERYYAIQKVIHEVCPHVWQAAPRTKQLKAYGIFTVKESTSLLAQKRNLAAETSAYPKTMEEMGTGLGYMLYSLKAKNYHRKNKLKVIEARDRVQIYVDGKFEETQYQNSVGEEIGIEGLPENETIAVDILVENMGRVNYGYKLNNPSQKKGIIGGVMIDIHFHQEFSQRPVLLDEKQVKHLDFSLPADSSHPSFYKFDLYLDELKDTYFDCSSYGKGVLLVNGINLGRYWQKGPIHSLYCPKDFLRKGINSIIVFETDGVEIHQLISVEHAILSDK
jgi:beta-galactosidase